MIVSGLSGGYPGGFFLKDLSFEVEEGKTAALLGLNGSGKTTILKLICGILKAQSGKVFIAGRDLLALPERERAKLISYVPQQSGIVYDISVLDVVLMGVSPHLRLFEMPGDGHIREALICLEKLGIGHLAYANYQTLSAGLKQMAIIARALLQNGKYMIFDEPDCNLDYINKNRLMKRIREITKVYRKGSLISMHDPALALNFCDRILLVRDGSITEIDLQKEPLGSIEEKLSIVYGNIKIQRCEGKYVVFLCD